MTSTIRILKHSDDFAANKLGAYSNFELPTRQFYYNKLPRFVTDKITIATPTITNFVLINVKHENNVISTDVILYALDLNVSYVGIETVSTGNVKYYFNTDYIQDLDSGYYYFYLKDSEGNERKSEIFYILNESINDGILNESSLNILTEVSQFLIPEGSTVYSIKISQLPISSSYTTDDRVLIYKPNEVLPANQVQTLPISEIIGSTTVSYIWGSDTLFSDFYTNNSLSSLTNALNIILKKETNDFRIDSVEEIPVYQNFEKITFINYQELNFACNIYINQDVKINCLPNLKNIILIVNNTNSVFCSIGTQYRILLENTSIDILDDCKGIDIESTGYLQVALRNSNMSGNNNKKLFNLVFGSGLFIWFSTDSLNGGYSAINETNFFGNDGNITIIQDSASQLTNVSYFTNFSGNVSITLSEKAKQTYYDKSLSSLDSENINDAIDELDAKKQSSLGYTPEDAANKENTTLDNSTTKYPTNNIVKSITDLKQTVFVGVCAECEILSTDIDIDYTNRTLTIARVGGVAVSASNPIRFFVDGGGIATKYEKTTAQVFTWTDTSGLWYFYFDNNGDPIATQTAWTDFDLIATVFRMTWNSAKSPDSAKAITHWYECHLNDISSKDHLWKHTQGAIWITGGTSVHNAIASGSPNADGRNTCFSITSVYLMDDNLLYEVINSTDSTDFNQDLGQTNSGLLTNLNAGIFNIRYKGAASAAELVTGTRFPFLWNSGTNIPEYVNTSGSRTPVSNGYFFVYILYALQDNRAGQAVRLTPAYAEYSTLSAAQAVTWATIQAQDTSANDGEIRPLYKLIFEYKSAYNAAVKYTALREVTDLRKQVVTQATNSGGSIPASSVTVIPAGNIAATDVLNALYELDNEKLVASTAANSIKGNATASTASATDITLAVNQLLARLSGNIQAVDIGDELKGYGTLIAGQCTITDSLITTSSKCIGWCWMDSNHTSVPLTATANSGNMVFSTGQSGDTAVFGYTILC